MMRRKASVRRINNVAAIMGNAIAPWLLFCFVVTVLCLRLRMDFPYLLPFVTASGCAFIIWCCYMTWRQAKRHQGPNSFWIGMFTLTTVIAVSSAFATAEFAYHTVFSDYYLVEAMQFRGEINPAKADGESLMDTGRAAFSENTYVMRNKGMSYTHDDHYCVAPITNGPDALSTYDFWAVGMNCCQTQVPDFKCGHANKTARNGLRAVNPDLLPYFNLARVQSEAEYGIASKYPLFFYWVKNANEEHLKRRDVALSTLIVSMTLHFSCNAFLIASLLFACYLGVI